MFAHCSYYGSFQLPHTKERADFTPDHGLLSLPPQQPGYINLFLEQRPSSLKGALEVSLGTGRIWLDFGVVELPQRGSDLVLNHSVGIHVVWTLGMPGSQHSD